MKRSFVAVIAALALGLLGTAPAHAADSRPNTLAGATTASPVSSPIKETIGYGSDVDWYRFRVATSGYSRILLNYLPNNYGLALYNASGQLLASSQRTGRTAFEEIYRSTPAGTYFVKVWSQDGTSSTTPYNLVFHPLANGLHPISTGKWISSTGYTFVFGMVLNNTAARYGSIQVNVRFYDAAGRQVDSAFTYLDSGKTVEPRTRYPFRVAKKVASTAVRFTVSVQGWTTTKAAFRGLTVAPGTPYAGSDGWRIYPGKVTNATGVTARNTLMHAVLYDAAASVRYIATQYTQPSDLAPRQTVNYLSSAPALTGIGYVWQFGTADAP